MSRARLKACGALGHDERIGDAMDAISFDDTLGEIERVLEGGHRGLETVSGC